MGTAYYAHSPGDKSKSPPPDTPDLRGRTEAAARRLHELVASGVTPPPVLKTRCRGCSLHDRCMPELLSRPDAVRRYHQSLFVLSPPG